jgi:hypothetical protein
MPLFKVTGRIWVALELRDFISRENDLSIDKLKIDDNYKENIDDGLGMVKINNVNIKHDRSFMHVFICIYILMYLIHSDIYIYLYVRIHLCILINILILFLMSFYISQFER